MGLFGKREKKTCAICGKELGVLGKTKLEDGYLCKDCARKLSPFFEDARRSTADEIRRQLEYREANKAILETFSPTRELGGTWRVLIDDNKGGIVITSDRDWRGANPDVIDFPDVKGCDVRIDETRRELYREGEDGRRESYHPPRYECNYDFWVTIRVDSPYFKTIKFKVNDWPVSRRPSAEYDRCEREAFEIRDALSSLGSTARQPYQQQGGYQQQGAAQGFPQQPVWPGTPARGQAGPDQHPPCQQPDQLAYPQQPQPGVMPVAAPMRPEPAAATGVCPSCGAANKAQARFCEFCGGPLA